MVSGLVFHAFSFARVLTSHIIQLVEVSPALSRARKSFVLVFKSR